MDLAAARPVRPATALNREASMSAKKDAKPAAAPATADAAPAKKGLPVKTIGVVGAIMAIEAVGVMLVFSSMGPKATHAETGHGQIKADAGQQTQELLIVEDRFQNLQSGKVWVWDSSVHVQVRQRNFEKVEGMLKQRNAEIKEGISQIFSRAQHVQLKEPDRQTLNRQITAFLQKVFGSDDQGAPYIERVLISKCRGFPADF